MPAVVCTRNHKRFLYAEFPMLVDLAADPDKIAPHPLVVEGGVIMKPFYCCRCAAELSASPTTKSERSLDAILRKVAPFRIVAVTDNAALTLLGSLIEGISDAAKYALVAGAVAGGGLTVIANAPNPAGVTLLKQGFKDQAIRAGGLLLGALAPTVVAATMFLI